MATAPPNRFRSRSDARVYAERCMAVAIGVPKARMTCVPLPSCTLLLAGALLHGIVDKMLQRWCCVLISALLNGVHTPSLSPRCSPELASAAATTTAFPDAHQHRSFRTRAKRLSASGAGREQRRCVGRRWRRRRAGTISPRRIWVWTAWPRQCLSPLV